MKHELKYIVSVLASVSLLMNISDSIGQSLTNVPEDFANIQAAINASSDGDTILVAPGTYTERINFMGKDVIVGSYYLTTKDTSYISQTIIDANQEGIAVLFENGESRNAVFTGFTVVNGYAAKGAGLYCSNASPTISHIVLRNHKTTTRGRAIVYTFNTRAVLEFLEISSNEGIGLVAQAFSDITIKNSTLSKNLSSGIEIVNSDNIRIDQCAIHHNGQGIYVKTSNAIIENSLIYNNAGSGINFEDAGGQVVNCTLYGNWRGINNSSTTNDVFIFNSIIWNSTYTELINGFRTFVFNSCVEDDGYDYSAVLIANNIAQDPQFVDSLQYDFRLKDISPCIGRGEDSLIISDQKFVAPSVDFLGTARPQPSSSLPDIGAFENALDYGQLAITISQNTNCPVDTVLQLTVMNGIEPVAIQWEGPGGFTDNHSVVSGPLAPGFYRVTVTDQRGQSAVDSVEVVIPPTRRYVATDGADTLPGTQEQPFASIQHAIDQSCDGDTVIVLPGTYYERAHIHEKSIVLASRFLFTSNRADIKSTILDGEGEYGRGIQLTGGTTTLVKGFSLAKWDSGTGTGSAIHIENSSPTISDIILYDISGVPGYPITVEHENYEYSKPVQLTNILSKSRGSRAREHNELNLINADVVVTNCVVGAILCKGGHITVINSYVYNLENSPFYTDSGGSVVDTRDLQLVVINSIIWGNEHYKRGYRIPSAQILHPGSQVHFIHTQIDSIETIPEAQVELDEVTRDLWPNPYFRYHKSNSGNDYPIVVQMETDDFHLTPQSPALESGVDSAQVNGVWYYAPSFDLENKPRSQPAGTPPDIGPYESGDNPVTAIQEYVDQPLDFFVYADGQSNELVFSLKDQTFQELIIQDIYGKTLLYWNSLAGNRLVVRQDLSPGVYIAKTLSSTGHLHQKKIYY